MYMGILCTGFSCALVLMRLHECTCMLSSLSDRLFQCTSLHLCFVVDGSSAYRVLYTSTRIHGEQVHKEGQTLSEAGPSRTGYMDSPMVRSNMFWAGQTLG